MTILLYPEQRMTSPKLTVTYIFPVVSYTLSVLLKAAGYEGTSAFQTPSELTWTAVKAEMDKL